MLFFLFLWALPSGSHACGPSLLIAIPWKNAPTQSGSNSRGVFLNAGKNQEQSLRITTVFSSTRIHDSVVCEHEGVVDRACEGQAGSTLITGTPEFNSSFQVRPNFNRDPNDAFINQQLGDFYQKEGHIPILLNTATGSIPLGDYPLLVMSLVLPNIQRKSGIGMGRWSTFLDRLYELGHVPSKVWGFSGGSYSSANPSDGELVIGGINPAAIDGEMRNFTISNTTMADGKQGIHCPTQVLVSNFVVSIQGIEYDLLPDRNFKIFACIDPYQQSISMPEGMMGQLLGLTGAMFLPPNGTESPKPLMNATSDRKIQNVSITIQDDIGSFTVTIPGNETMNPVYGKLPDGKNGWIEGNLTQLEFRNRSDNYPVEDPYNELPSLILGGIFLSQQYLMLDYSRNKFGLAPLAQNRAVSNGDGLIRICDADNSGRVIAAAGEYGDGLKIGLSVLSGVAWLLVIILSSLIIYLCRSRVRERGDSSSAGRRVSKGSKNYHPMRVIERQFSSISAPPKPLSVATTNGPVAADANSSIGYTENTETGRH
ncbi:hypothetical protein TWF730_009827 [Orbilia blumenaviensis]|uniref:Peptidase A1 domain-containing protein n=1 Tax=Orbilia blumenaviensis TaxID=1796055 RepID=A0AAV9UUA2_9PEZI